MSIDDDSLPHVFLKAGEVYIAEQPAVVTTVLGSCVSVIMYNRHHRIGAICHSLLPVCEHRDKIPCDRSFEECYRFSGCSVWAMVKVFKKHGISSQNIEVKLFGGASIFGLKENLPAYMYIGERNIQAARQAIAETGLRLVSYNVGGLRGCKIIFYTHTGKVLLKRV